MRDWYVSVSLISLWQPDGLTNQIFFQGATKLLDQKSVPHMITNNRCGARLQNSCVVPLVGKTNQVCLFVVNCDSLHIYANRFRVILNKDHNNTVIH